MNLGYCHLYGRGVPADKTEALRLFRLAVEQGEAKAGPEVERLEGTVKKPRIRFVDATEGDALRDRGGGWGDAAEESVGGGADPA